MIWFDYFELQTWLKIKCGYLPHEYKRPFDCFTCTNWWFGIIIGTLTGIVYLILFGFGWWLIDLPLFFGWNFLIGNLIDHIKYS
jgi:hypothetical protein